MSKLTLDQVRAFLCIVRMGGVRKAGLALNLSQPAVTARIKALEEALTRTLFERTAGGVTLTREGELFLTYAERFEHLSQLVEKNVIDPVGLEGCLRIGAAETITQCWLPDFVSRLHRQFPRLQVEINVDISVNLRAGLLDREIDLAFLLGPVSEPSIENTELPGFDLAWYAAADTDSNGDPARYLRYPVVSYSRQTRPYRELKELLLEHVGPGVMIFPSSSLSACFRLVESGIGVAALPRLLGQVHVDQGRLREFDPGWIPPPLRFTASYSGEPKSPMVETVARMARDVARDGQSIRNSD